MRVREIFLLLQICFVFCKHFLASAQSSLSARDRDLREADCVQMNNYIRCSDQDEGNLNRMMAEESDIPQMTMMMINEVMNGDMAAKMRERFLSLRVPL